MQQTTIADLPRPKPHATNNQATGTTWSHIMDHAGGRRSNAKCRPPRHRALPVPWNSGQLCAPRRTAFQKRVQETSMPKNSKKAIMPGSRQNEESLQSTILHWMEQHRPDLLCIHIPNGAIRTHRERRRMLEQGMVPGMPDLLLIDAEGRHGYMEVKTDRGIPVHDAVGYPRGTGKAESAMGSGQISGRRGTDPDHLGMGSTGNPCGQRKRFAGLAATGRDPAEVCCAGP